jgi:hypothetical protein
MLFLLMMLIPFSVLGCWLCKDKYPANFAALGVLTVTVGTFMGAANESFAGHSNFQIGFFVLTATLLTTLLSCWKFKGVNGEDELMNITKAAAISYAFTLVISILLRITYPQGTMRWFAFSTFWSSVAVLWFGWETAKLSEKMNPDQYMVGVVYFYADIVAVMACLLMCCLFCGAGGDAGAVSHSSNCQYH